MSINYKWFLSLILSSMVVFSFSCRNDTSSLNTLDEFAGIAGSNKMNVCHGGSGVSVSNINAGSLTAVVKSTLSAVPEGVQKVFSSAGGQIIVDSSEARAKCANVINDPKVVRDIYGGAASGVFTCWRAQNGKPIIYLEEDEAKIKHSLLRVFAYFITQAVVPGASKVSSTASLAKVSQDKFNKLSESFLSDLEKIDSSRASRFSTEFSRDMLNQYVFAESFDSYYCNSSTRNSMKSKFANTYKAFTDMYINKK